jgi:hypothetical protein
VSATTILVSVWVFDVAVLGFGLAAQRRRQERERFWDDR